MNQPGMPNQSGISTRGDRIRLAIACVLAVLIMVGWQVFWESPRQEALREQQLAADAAAKADQLRPIAPATIVRDAQAARYNNTPSVRDESVVSNAQVAIETPSLRGTIALQGAVIRQMSLLDYRQTDDPASPPVALFDPRATQPYNVRLGWVGRGVEVPSPRSVWQVVTGTTLTPSTPISLAWVNATQDRFVIDLRIDAQFLVQATFKVVWGDRTNARDRQVSAYAAISRGNTVSKDSSYILHEGPIAWANSQLNELSYDDVEPQTPVTYDPLTTADWLGFTDKYWLVAVSGTSDGGVGRFTTRAPTNAGQAARVQADLTMAVSPETPPHPQRVHGRQGL